MSYRFYVSSTGGQFGWIRWRNKLSICRLPQWMKPYENCFWGRMYVGSPQSAAAWEKLIQISEDMGNYL